ncbi:wax ester/triacylglycerol synthase domain-containing protein [Mycobacterium sp. 1423905.2]|uniref:wax ester/triacylglycerol synthase domain-containing protein n=1 Tax=Mycobacterium sp. 1423905.2 TaxID=1856859 RepID=UPI0008004ABA|nr:wax ester/triacylglycerol synthase domain-containing protein [Mycobacterium sp. 1423905.2]OBJ52772.1 diacylglycerol O-acyltransferase [Mycobacterium sp. 1423905.2]
MANSTTLENASLAFGAVAIIEGAVPSYRKLKSLFSERIPPVWTDQPSFHLDQHIQRVALPGPGDDTALRQAIAHALERPVEPLRLPWECWIIEGLQRNRWAILMKVQHGMADGASAAHLLGALCDDADTTMFAENPAGTSISPPRVAPRTWADTLRQAPWTAAAHLLQLPATLLSPTGPHTVRRHYRTVRVPRSDIDRVCRKFGVSGNDVALAAISEGFRAVLLHRGEEPRADAVRTLERTDSRIPAQLPYLPVEHGDPIRRLRAVHTQRIRPTPSPGRSTGLSDLLPVTLCARAFHAFARKPHTGVVTLSTSAPGPRHRLRLMGQSLAEVLPIPPTALQQSTGVAVLSYGDQLVFGMTDAYDAASDLAQLAAGIERGIARLVALSEDSVLLFGKDRRRRSSRATTGGAQRHTFTPSVHARH